MSSAPGGETIEVAADGIRVVKGFEADEFPVPAITFAITSDRSEPVGVRVVDDIPTEFSMDGVGFHPDYDGDNWTAYQDHRVAYERVVAPDEEVVTVYGIRVSSTEEVGPFLTEPSVEIAGTGTDADDLGIEADAEQTIDELAPRESSQVVRDLIAGEAEVVPGVEGTEPEGTVELREDVAAAPATDAGNGDSPPRATGDAGGGETVDEDIALDDDDAEAILGDLGVDDRPEEHGEGQEATTDQPAEAAGDDIGAEIDFDLGEDAEAGRADAEAGVDDTEVEVDDAEAGVDDTEVEVDDAVAGVDDTEVDDAGIEFDEGVESVAAYDEDDVAIGEATEVVDDEDGPDDLEVEASDDVDEAPAAPESTTAADTPTAGESPGPEPEEPTADGDAMDLDFGSPDPPAESTAEAGDAVSSQQESTDAADPSDRESPADAAGPEESPADAGLDLEVEADESAAASAAPSSVGRDDDMGPDSGIPDEGDDDADAGAVTFDDPEDGAPSEPTTIRAGKAAGVDVGTTVVGTLVEELEAGTVPPADLDTLRDALGNRSADGPTRSQQARLEHLESRVDEFDAYSDALRAFIDREGTADEIIAEFESELETMRSAIDRMDDQLADGLDTVDDATTGVERMESRLAETESEVDSVAGRLDGLAADVDAVDADTDQLAALVDDHDGSLEELSGGLDAVRGTTETLDAAVEGLEESVATNTEEVEATTDAVESVDDRLAQQGQTLEDAVGRVDDNARRLDEVDDRFSTLAEAVEQLDDETTTLSSAVETLEDGLGRLDDDLTDVDADLGEDLDSVRQELSSLQEAVEDISAWRDQLGEMFK